MSYLNSPSNPTGVVQSEATLKKLATLLADHPHVWVLSDEIYQELTFSREPLACFTTLAPNLRDRTITISGLSKCAAMTGWRLGWSVAPKELTERMLRVQSQSTSGTSSLTQEAGEAVLASWGERPDIHLQPLRLTYHNRALASMEALQGLPGLHIIRPQGAFYLWCLTQELDTSVLARDLLERAGVGVVPGGPFGDPSAFRLSFACKDQDLAEGLQRIQAFFRARTQSGA
jgi:aspartate aminotransferase